MVRRGRAGIVMTLEVKVGRHRRSEPTQLRHNRTYLLLWTGAGVSMLGSRMSAIAYSLVVLWATDSATSTAMVTFAALLPFLVTQLPAGVLVDRLDRRRVMIGCDLGRVLLIGIALTTVAMGHVWVPLLMVIAFCEGSLTEMYSIAERAAVFTVVPDEQLGVAVGANEARSEAAGLIGQPIGTFLFSALRWLPFAATIVSHLLSLFTLLLIRRPLQGPRPDGPRPSPVQDVKEGFDFVRSQTYLRRALGLIAASNLLFQVLALGLLVIVKDQGGGPDTIGWILLASGIGGMLGALSSNLFMRWVGVRWIFMGVNIFWTLLMGSMVFFQQPLALGVIFSLLLFGAGMANVAGIVYTMKVAPEDMQGRIGSIVSLLSSGANALGALCAGAILDALGVRTTMIIVGCSMLVIAIAAVLAFGGRKAAAAEAALGDLTE
jgi:predicted MFS family arabinose efflux permease